MVKTKKKSNKKNTSKKVKKTKKQAKKKPVSKKHKKSPKKSVSKKESKAPQTMEELIENTGYNFIGLKKGEEVEGVITDISKKTILVDIGAKTEGVILNKELSEIPEFIEDFKIGDTIKSIVFSPENDKGQILLSIKDSAMDHKWDTFQEYLDSSKAVKVRGLEVNKGGLIARFMRIRGFVPASQFGSEHLGKIENLQNKLFKVKIIELDREKNRLIFSEKAVSEAAALAQKQQALKKVKKGEVYEGLISGVMPFGIFVRVEIEDGMVLEGLVHISEISWEKVDNLNKLYNVGDKVEVKVLEIDKDSGKLNLSIKQLTPDPWLDLVKKYPKDKKVKGKVTKLTSFGAFVQLEEGVEGLVHISKIPADISMDVGNQVDVYVESVDEEKRRMSLGLVLKEKPVGYK